MLENEKEAKNEHKHFFKFFFKWAILGLFLFIFVFSNKHYNSFFKFLMAIKFLTPQVRKEKWSGDGRNWSRHRWRHWRKGKPGTDTHLLDEARQTTVRCANLTDAVKEPQHHKTSWSQKQFLKFGPWILQCDQIKITKCV